MATLTYYSFSKRHRSTATPTGGSQIDVQLKDGTSLISPVFLLNWSGVPSFNYVQFEGRYYFVNEITSVRMDLWEIRCEEDYLASHKSDIGSTVADILYATGGSNDIIDNRIPTKSPISIGIEIQSITGFTIRDDTMGAVILSITGVGSFGTYLLKDSNDLPYLMKDVSLYSAAHVTDVVTGLQQRLSNGNIADNLKGAIALPLIFNASYVSSGVASYLYLGEYPCTTANNNPTEAYHITKPILKGYVTINIPWQGRTGWLRRSPYTELYLFVPLIGCLHLPVDDLINDTSIEVAYSINVTSGDVAVLVAGTNSGLFIASASSNCAMATPYGSANISSEKVASAVITGAGGIAAAAALSNPVAALAALGGGLASSALQLLSAHQGQTSGGGGLGGGASQGLYTDVRLVSICKDLTDSPSSLNPIIGKPVMAKHTVQTYSGYVQTDGMQVAGNMLDSEREMINSLCDGGIYYE